MRKFDFIDKKREQFRGGKNLETFRKRLGISFRN